jgi:hypothetical protein
MKLRYARIALATLASTIALGILGGPALAAPTNAKNAFSGMAQCDSGQSYSFVVNNANGQGQGAQNNGQNQGEWAPAHLSNGQVFHPTAFDLTFTFTPANGQSQSFTNTDARKNQTGNLTCQISGSQTDPQGNTFSLSGSVTGTIS